jgi:hypothetical protein
MLEESKVESLQYWEQNSGITPHQLNQSWGMAP